jgi:hypothetical protein
MIPSTHVIGQIKEWVAILIEEGKFTIQSNSTYYPSPSEVEKIVKRANTNIIAYKNGKEDFLDKYLIPFKFINYSKRPFKIDSRMFRDANETSEIDIEIALDKVTEFKLVLSDNTIYKVPLYGVDLTPYEIITIVS